MTEDQGSLITVEDLVEMARGWRDTDIPLVLRADGTEKRLTYLACAHDQAIFGCPTLGEDGISLDTDRLRTVDEKLLRSTGDAMVWAAEFMKMFKGVDEANPLDEGTMIGWFANAMQTALDLRDAEQEIAAVGIGTFTDCYVLPDEFDEPPWPALPNQTVWLTENGVAAIVEGRFGQGEVASHERHDDARFRARIFLDPEPEPPRQIERGDLVHHHQIHGESALGLCAVLGVFSGEALVVPIRPNQQGRCRSPHLIPVDELRINKGLRLSHIEDAGWARDNADELGIKPENR